MAVGQTWILNVGGWPVGTNTCGRWVGDLESRLPKDFGDNDPCMLWASTRVYKLDSILSPNHVTYEVTMCDGTKITADNGAWSGPDHIKW